VQLETFYGYESISKDQQKLSELKNIYEDMYTDNNRIHPAVRYNIVFQLMRQAFISPIELPILTECFLRRDFNFSMYLGYCITDFLSEIIGFINLKVYFFMIVLIGVYRLINVPDQKPSSAILYPIPFVCLAVLFICKWHLQSIYSYLVPEVDSPHDIQFQVDVDIRDPFDHINKFPVPPYLKNGFEDQIQRPSEMKEDSDSEDDESDSEFNGGTRKPKDNKRQSDMLNNSDEIDDSIFQDQRKKERADSWMFKSGKRFFFVDQNRHERLFLLGKFGVTLQKLLIQGCYITNVLWFSALIAGDGFDRWYVFDKDPADVALMIVCISVSLFTILIYFPTVVFAYVLDTSIQMMKRRDYMELVIKEQKHQKALRSMRMYQVFKLIRRELIEAFNEDVEDRPLPITHDRLLQENYDMINEAYDNEEAIRLEQLSEFTHLTGNKLKKHESYMLIKKAKSDGRALSYAQLKEAIKQTSNDVKVDPYDVISRIFLMLANVEHQIMPDQLDEFFSEYQGYFERHDVEEFRDEILSLQRDGGQIDIQEIASLIRDDIECFPR
jgi:ABC-type multidrug transport system fused ATPase/permease subunit